MAAKQCVTKHRKFLSTTRKEILQVESVLRTPINHVRDLHSFGTPVARSRGWKNTQRKGVRGFVVPHKPCPTPHLTEFQLPLANCCRRGGPSKGTKSKLATSPLPSWGPHQRGRNQNLLPHPCLLRGPHEGGNATSTLPSRGSPSKWTKSKVAPSPLPSRGPT